MRTSIASGLVFLFVGGIAACSGGNAGPRPDAGAAAPAGITVVRPLQLTAMARLPESDPSVEEVLVSSDRLVLRLRAGAAFELGVGNVVAGVQGGGYLRRITAVARPSATSLEATTTAATLGELVADGAFTVRQRRGEAAWTAASKPGQSAAALESRVQVFSPMLVQGLQCAGTGTSGFSYTPVLDFDLDLDVEIDIRPGAFGGPGRLHSALFAVEGVLDVGSVIKTTEAFGVMCQLDVVRLIRTRLGNLNLMKWERTQGPFLVGSVPILLKHSIDPVFNVSIAGQATHAGLETRDVTTYTLRTGAEYRDGAWRGIWSPAASGRVTVRTPPEVGGFSVTVGGAAGIQYKVLVWDVAGPKLSLESVVEAKVTGNPLSCTWNATVEGGVNAVIGAELQVPVVDTTLADYSVTFNLLKEEVASTSGPLGMCTVDGGPPPVVPAACNACDPSSTFATYTEARIAMGRGPSGAAFWRRKYIPPNGSDGYEDRFEFRRWLPDDANTPPGQSRMLVNHRYTTCPMGTCRSTDTEVTLTESGLGPAGVASTFKVGAALAHGGVPRCTLDCGIARDDGTPYVLNVRGVPGATEEYQCVGCGNACTRRYYADSVCIMRTAGDCSNAMGNGSLGIRTACP